VTDTPLGRHAPDTRGHRRLDRWAAALLLALAIPINVYAGGGETCAAQRLGSDLNCTANDVQLVNLVLSSSYTGSLSCVAGQTITLDIDATFSSGGAQRYDVGFFVSEDGKSPQDLPGSGGANTCHVGILPETPDPPFADLDGDNCGEVRANQSGTTTLTGVTVRCQADASGQLVIPMVVSWAQNANSILCMSSLDPVPGTKSKCSGGLVGTIPPITVYGSLTIRKETVPDGDPQAFNFSASTTSGQPLSTTGFALGDGQSQAITIPITGSSRDITVTEAALSGWNLSGLACVDGSGNPAGFVTTDLATRTVTANLSATNPTATCTYTNQKHPDLAITKTGPASVNVAAPISYSITATNNGPGNVSGASIADTVPVNITAVTWTCAATGTADCDTTLPGTGAAGAGNSISLGNVAINAGAGNAVTITVSGTAATPGPITNTATVGPPPAPRIPSPRTTARAS